MNEDDRRVLVEIERRIVDEDPVLALLARRLTVQAQRRGPVARSPAPAARGERTMHQLRVTVAGMTVTAVVVSVALGLWPAVLCCVAVAAYIVARRVVSPP